MLVEFKLRVTYAKVRANWVLSPHLDQEPGSSQRGGNEALRAKLQFVENKVYQAADGVVADEVLQKWLNDFDKSRGKALLNSAAKNAANADAQAGGANENANRHSGMRGLPYIDDFLVLVDSQREGFLRREKVQRVLHRLGLRRNEKKSQWDPVQVVEHLGLEDLDDWRLNREWFVWASEQWGPFTVERFASEISAQLPRYYAAWRDPQCKGVDSLVSSNEDGKAHVLYDDGDEETLDLSKENFKIISSLPVSVLTNEAAYTANENVDKGADYKVNKRGGAVENFLTLSLCERWRSELGRSRLTELAVKMQRKSLLDTTLSNYGPKAQRFIHFCVQQCRPWLPATEATVVLYVASVLEDRGVQAASMQPHLSAIDNYHEDLGFPGPAKGRALTRAVKGMATIQAELAMEDENIETQRTWLPAGRFSSAVQHYIDPTALRDTDMNYYFEWLTWSR
eukprot:gene34042-biopygen6435